MASPVTFVCSVWRGGENNDGKTLRGQRRWGLGTAFPLIGSNGVTVISDCRTLTDHRLGNISLEDRLMLFSEMPNPAAGPQDGHQGNSPQIS